MFWPHPIVQPTNTNRLECNANIQSILLLQHLEGKDSLEISAAFAVGVYSHSRYPAKRRCTDKETEALLPFGQAQGRKNLRGVEDQRPAVNDVGSFRGDLMIQEEYSWSAAKRLAAPDFSLESCKLVLGFCTRRVSFEW